MRGIGIRGSVVLALMIVLGLMLIASPAEAIGGPCVVEVHLGGVNVCI